MKKGLNLWTLAWSAQRGQPPFLEVARFAKQLDYQGIEFIFDDDDLNPTKWPDQQIRRFKEDAESMGLEIPSVATGIFWKYNLGSGDRKMREAGVLWGKRGLRLARALGAEVLLVVPGVSEPTTSYAKTYDFAKESVRQMADLAEDLDVTIGVENVWNKFLYSPMEFRRFIEEVGSRKVKAYLDIANVVAIGHPLHWIEALGNLIVRVHAKDFDSTVGNIEGFRHIGNGNIDWKEAVSALKTVGYDGYLIVECPPSFYPGLKNPTFEDGRKAAADNSKALDAILGVS